MKCIGWADKEAQIPLGVDHIFRVFSNTKLITSCAALLLFEEGRFQLDDPIEQFISKLANRRVQAIVNVDERAIRPQRVSQFITADQFSGTIQEQGEDLKGLDLKSDLFSVLEDLTSPQVDREIPEARHVRGGRGGHGDPMDGCIS